MSLLLLQAYVEGLGFFAVALRVNDPGHPLCTTCGVCCAVPAWRPITPDDRARLCAFLGLSGAEFDARYTHPKEASCLRAPCAFLQRVDGRYLCSVYEARPGVCQSFNRCVPVQLDPPNVRELIADEQTRFADYFAKVEDA